MIDWINLTIFSILLIGIFYLLYLVAKYKTQRNNLYSLGAYMNNELFENQKRISELEKQIEQINLKETDGFVKFLSTSREWAFQYIEQVQSALSEFSSEVEPILEWCNTYGIAIDEIHSEQVKKISLAYDKLKRVLPKDNETPNN